MVFKNSRFIVASLLVMGVAACAGDGQGVDTKTVKKAPVRMDIGAPMGLQINAYDDDIQNALATLNGMTRTLDRMEGDLQTLTLKRIAAMRDEIESTNRQLAQLQKNLADAGVVKPSGLVAKPQEVRGDMARVEGQMPAAAVEPVSVEPVKNDVKVAVPAGLEPKMSEPVKAQVKKEEPKKVEAKVVDAAPKGTGVVAARIGVHPDKVRVVLDVVGAPVKHVSHFDDVEKLLTVELPKLDWTAKLEQAFEKNPLIARYAAQKSEGGSTVVFSLKDGAKVSDPIWIAGSGKTPSRMIIDITQ